LMLVLREALALRTTVDWWSRGGTKNILPMMWSYKNLHSDIFDKCQTGFSGIHRTER